MGNQKITSYQDLIMWQKAKDFAIKIYGATEKFPSEERYGLTNQIRRASVSIASNIAEGFRRKYAKEKIQFLRIAYGSGAEIETQLIIAEGLHYLEQRQAEELKSNLDEIMKIINVVINKL